MTKTHILFVDDDPKNGKWFVKNMELLGFEVEFCTDIGEAKSRLESDDSNFDVLICDYLFEGGDQTGLDLLDFSRKAPIVRVLCTAFSGLEDDTIQYPVFAKPVDYNALSQFIESSV